MKIALRITLMCLIAIFAVTGVNAQKKDKKAPKEAKASMEEKTQAFADEIAGIMKLDDAMKQKIYEVNLEAKKKVRVISKEYKDKEKAGETVNLEEKKTRVKAVWKESNKLLRKALGKKQYKQYKEVKKQVKSGEKED